MEDSIETGAHLRADIIVERQRSIAEAREDQAAIALDAQLLQAVVLRLEITRHPRRHFEAVAERHASQVAPRIVAPLMIGADVGPCIASRRATDHRATMRASIDPR